MKKLLTSILIFAMTIMFVGCNSGTANEDGGTTEESKDITVGLALPTKSSQRWIDDGNNMKKEFEKLGYKVDMQFAEDIVENQVSQIENMITKGVNVLVIGSIDGVALVDVINKAADEGIPVIAYDRLIKGTENISYYSTFDNFEVGVLQGNYIIEKLGLDKGEKGPFNIELFGGSPDDNNAALGLMATFALLSVFKVEDLTKKIFGISYDDLSQLIYHFNNCFEMITQTYYSRYPSITRAIQNDNYCDITEMWIPSGFPYIAFSESGYYYSHISKNVKIALFRALGTASIF